MGIETTKNYSAYKLSSDEIENPYLVLENLFDYAHLPQVREIFWNSFKATITGSYPKKLSWNERNEIVCLYEYIEKLIEAAHLLLKTRNDKGFNLPIENETNASYEFFPEKVNATNIKRICEQNHFTAIDQINILIQLIVQITNAEKIFFANLSIDKDNNPLYDFVVLLPDNAPVSFEVYKKEILKNCASFGSVVVWCARLSEIMKFVEEGHIYFSVVYK